MRACRWSSKLIISLAILAVSNPIIALIFSYELFSTGKQFRLRHFSSSSFTMAFFLCSQYFSFFVMFACSSFSLLFLLSNSFFIIPSISSEISLLFPARFLPRFLLLFSSPFRPSHFSFSCYFVHPPPSRLIHVLTLFRLHLRLPRLPPPSFPHPCSFLTTPS